jgi:VanZ family protein
MTFNQLLKACCLTVLVVLVFVGLGPATWQPRSGLGWEIDHFAGYFVITLVCCLAWPRPLVVGGVLTVFAVLLEGAQAFFPDRSAYYLAAVYSAAGVLVAAQLAELFVRVGGFGLVPGVLIGLSKRASAEHNSVSQPSDTEGARRAA